MTKRHGNPPQQTIDEDETFELNIPASRSSILDDDIYDDVVSDEDIDNEGLDISEGQPFDS